MTLIPVDLDCVTWSEGAVSEGGMMSCLVVVILRQQRQKEDLDAALRYVPNTGAWLAAGRR